MGADGVVRHTDGHPVSAFLSGTFADEIHDPHLLRVAEREGLAFRRIAVLVDEGDEPLDRLAGGLAALQRDIDERPVVDADGVPERLSAAPGGLTDGDLVLVHVTDYRIGVRHLRDSAQRAAGVPVFDLAHGPFGPVLCRREMQETVHAVRVGGVGDHRTAVRRGVLAYQEIGAGLDS